MFCIAAFLVLLIAAAISAKYRRLLRKAWGCVGRRVTFRACDSSFKEDTKGALLAPLAVRAPRLVKPASAAIEVAAVLLVVTTVVSGYIVVRSATNYFVYGTCDPQDAASCTLSSQVCSVGSAQPGFLDSVFSGDVVGAFANEFGNDAKTIQAIPARLRSWDATKYLPAGATYRYAYAPKKPTALEIVDPGCIFCKKLYEHITSAGFAKTHNLTYIPYPIHTSAGYKFQNSLLVSQYLEALRMHPRQVGDTTADWYVLEQVYGGKTADGVENQIVLDAGSRAQAVSLLHGWLKDAGYSAAEIAEVDSTAHGSDVAAAMARNRKIVEDQVGVVAIPTIIFGGARHSGAVPVDQLR